MLTSGLQRAAPRIHERSRFAICGPARAPTAPPRPDQSWTPSADSKFGAERFRVDQYELGRIHETPDRLRSHGALMHSYPPFGVMPITNGIPASGWLAERPAGPGIRTVLRVTDPISSLNASHTSARRARKGPLTTRLIRRFPDTMRDIFEQRIRGTASRRRRCRYRRSPGHCST